MGEIFMDAKTVENIKCRVAIGAYMNTLTREMCEDVGIRGSRSSSDAARHAELWPSRGERW